MCPPVFMKTKKNFYSFFSVLVLRVRGLVHRSTGLFVFLTVISDQHNEFPYNNKKALASQGLLGLIIPKEYGGLGQNHVCCVMVVETIARYGCPSTAMMYSEYRVHVRKKKQDLHRNMLIYLGTSFLYKFL